MIEADTKSDEIIRQLCQIGKNFGQGFDNQIVQILNMCLKRFELDIGLFSKIESNRYIITHSVTPDDVELEEGLEFDLGSTFCQITCQADAPVAIESISTHEQYSTLSAYQIFSFESYIGIPLKINGKLLGTLSFSSIVPTNKKFKKVDIEVLQLIIMWVEGEIIRRQQQQRLHELQQIIDRKAYEDSLTCIPNHRAMYQHVVVDINRITREKGKATLAIIDIDLFKNINNYYGHDKGDEVLIKVASTINNNKRDYDFLSRLGGEEFLLWLPNSDSKTANIVCNRIKDRIESLTLFEKPITISIGISCYQYGDLGHFKDKEGKVDQMILDQLITEANDALYKAKVSGRNCIMLYERLEQLQT